MEIQVYDKNFTQIAIIDEYVSLIWTKRYKNCGDFEITMGLESEIPSWADLGNYLSLKEDPEEGYFMILERIEVEQDVETGDTLQLSGRSLESILDRRIVWTRTIYQQKTTAAVISDLIKNAIIAPSLASRKIENFVFESPPADEEFTKVDAEYTGDDLLLITFDLCQEDDYSISILYILDESLFKCKMYKGVDRSYDNKDQNDIVIFSDDMNNLLSNNYYKSSEKYKNVILAMGQGTGTNRTKYVLGDVKGIERREYYKDARNVETAASLKQSASEAMKEYRIKSLMEGTVSVEFYEYGVDYLVGDIVQFKNKRGILERSRVIEVIFSDDESGTSIYPTLESIDDEEE